MSEEDDTPTQNIEPAIDIKHLSPNAEYLESGRSLMSNPRQRLLRWVGSRSLSKRIGERFGGSDSEAIFARFAELDSEPSRLMEIGRQLLGSGIPQNKKPHVAKYATGTRRVLNPSDPKRWGEVKAIARAMGEHAARAADVELPEEERLLSLERCWAWCAIHHPLLIHYHRCLTACAWMHGRRDAWCHDHMYMKVWIIVKLLTLMMVEGEANGMFTSAEEEDAMCPIDLEPFRNAGADAIFFSIHPCV